VHTNQWLGQFSFADYQQYLSAVDVDLITIDNYDFPGGTPPGAELRNTSTVGLVQACATVRDASVYAGPNGSIPFGYYMQGYELKPGCAPRNLRFIAHVHHNHNPCHVCSIFVRQCVCLLGVMPLLFTTWTGTCMHAHLCIALQNSLELCL
jgi:hypothetical protein